MPKKIPIIPNTKYRRLTILKESGRKNSRVMVECKCDCGNIIRCEFASLRSGNTNSCGCYNRENCAKRVGDRNRTHGLTKSREFECWHRMKQRCYDCKNPSYKHYGERGITVCGRWHKFENFLEDMGPRPSDFHSIDRIDVNGNYDPGNCKWSTPYEQQNNRRNNHKTLYNGEMKTISQIAKETGVNYFTLWSRVQKKE